MCSIDTCVLQKCAEMSKHNVGRALRRFQCSIQKPEPLAGWNPMRGWSRSSCAVAIFLICKSPGRRRSHKKKDFRDLARSGGACKLTERQKERQAAIVGGTQMLANRDANQRVPNLMRCEHGFPYPDIVRRFALNRKPAPITTKDGTQYRSEVIFKHFGTRIKPSGW